MIDWLTEHPRSLTQLLAYCQEEYGKTISRWTAQRILKASGLVWKRIRHSLKSKRDQAAFQAFAQQLRYWKIAEDRGVVDLYFFDESGFNLTPYIPYAWQKKGQHIELFPDNRRSHHTVLGFMNRAVDFHASIVKGAPNSEVVIACIDQFCKELRNKAEARAKTIVVMDNNPTHRSKKFQERIPQWKQQGLFIVYLPPYSPELNLIEILWRFIKYKWLPWSAYLNENSLVNELVNILENIGTQYRITFT